MATPLYVDPSKANDDGDGTAPATAKKTIAAAYTAVDDGGSVYLLAGTYNESTQGSGWQVTFSAAKSVTIKPDPATAPSITIAPTAATRIIYFSQAGAAYTHRLEGVTVTPASGIRLAEIAATCLGTCEIVDCVFPTSAEKFYAAAQAAATRTIRIQGCTITSSNAALIDLRGGALLDISDNTIVASGTSSVIRLDSVWTRVAIEDNTITSVCCCVETTAACTCTHVAVRRNTMTVTPAAEDAVIRFRDNITNVSITIEDNFITVGDAEVFCHGVQIGWSDNPATTTYYASRVIGNVLVNNSTNLGYAVYLGVGVDLARVAFNDISGGWYAGVFVSGLTCIIDSNYIECLNCIRGFGGRRSYFVHNHLISNNNGDSGRCIVQGRSTLATSTATTTYTATTVTDGGATPWGDAQGLVTAGLVAMVGDELLPTHYGVVASIDGDEVTVESWHAYDASNTTETPDNGDVVNICEYPRDWVVTDNICDGRQADYTITYDFDPVDSRGWQDRNVYVAGTTALSNLGLQYGAAFSTLEALQARWALYAATNQENDANSQLVTYSTSKYIRSTRWWRAPGWQGRIRQRGLLLPL